MDDSFKDKWSVFLDRYRFQSCSFCKKQGLNFDEPKQDKIADTDVLVITCMNCGHVEIFDVGEVCRAADKLTEDSRKQTFW